MKGSIGPIKYEQVPEEYKLNEWTKLDRIFWATIQMHLVESMYYGAIKFDFHSAIEDIVGHI